MQCFVNWLLFFILKYIFFWLVFYLDDNGGYGGYDDVYGDARSLLFIIMNLSLIEIINQVTVVETKSEESCWFYPIQHNVIHRTNNIHTACNSFCNWDRPDQGWQLHVVLAWQVSDRSRTDRGGQLHLVQCRQVSDGIGPDCWDQLHLVLCWEVPDRVWSDWWAQLHMVCTWKVPDWVRLVLQLSS